MTGELYVVGTAPISHLLNEALVEEAGRGLIILPAEGFFAVGGQEEGTQLLTQVIAPLGGKGLLQHR